MPGLHAGRLSAPLRRHHHFPIDSPARLITIPSDVRRLFSIVSADADEEAGIEGVDLCCCNGAGMRFLVRFRGVASMRGVDATAKVVERSRQRCQALGLAEKIRFTLADVCATGLPAESADFVWGEDAWCYVVDKPKLAMGNEMAFMQQLAHEGKIAQGIFIAMKNR